jgi:parallel beta-helix repeat protein
MIITRNVHKLTIWLGALALAAVCAQVRADVFYVTDAQSLQNALTLAAGNLADNTIYLTNGYYVGNFNYNNSVAHNLTVLPLPGVTNTQVTLDGAGTGRDMNLTDTTGGNITVLGITFLRNCGSTSIGALRIAAGTSASVVVQNCLFLSPSNSSGMGLELASGLNATVTNCTAAGATTGGGGTGISIGVTGNVTMQNCTVSTNNGSGISVSGGVIAVTGNIFIANSGSGAGCSGTTVTLSGNTFTGNSGAGASFGGNPVTETLTGNIFTGNLTHGCACNGNGTTTLTITSNIFTGNYGDGNGGGGAECFGVTATLIGNTFIRNSGAYYNGIGGGAGGGVVMNGNATLINNTFTGNSAVGQGGGFSDQGGAATLIGNTFTGNSTGINGSGGSGGGACISGGTVTGNTFTGNSATGGGGGGLYISGSAPTISGNTFKQNYATTGGGICAFGQTVTISDNLLAQNTSSVGGGIFVNASSSLFLINNTITANTSSGTGGGAAFQVSGVVELLNVYNNIIWGNTASGNGGDVWLGGTGQKKLFLFNDVDSMYGVWDLATNNIDLAPQFFDPVNGDYHIQSTSPCANAGTNGAPSLPLTDLDGNSRTNSAGLVDMGCYEFNTTATHPADTDTNWVITAAEFNAYAAAWKAGQTWTNAPNPIPANYVTRAGYLMTNGGTYHNDGSARPVNWKTGP